MTHPRHAALVSFGSHGDLHPFLGLGTILRNRGWRVTLVANVRYAEAAAGHSLGFHAVGDEADFQRFAGNPDAWHRRRAAHLVFGAMAESARPTVAALDALTPDVLVAGTLAAGARVWRESHDVPLVTVHLQPTAFRSCVDPPRLPGVPPIDLLPAWLKPFVLPGFWRGADRYVLDRIVRDLAVYRAELGLPLVTGYMDAWWHSPDRVLAMWPGWFAPPPPDWPTPTRLCGFPLYDERDTHTLDPGTLAFLDAGEPPVAFTPGSAMFFGERFFAAAVGACERLGRRGLLLTRHAAHLPARLPDSVRHVAFAPFGVLLPRCAAVVHHGGIGTLSQGLRAGIPQVVMPMAHDQPDNARRLQSLGVGEAIPVRAFKARRVSNVLSRLLTDARVATRCQDVRRQMHDMAGLEEAADQVERATVAPVAASLT